MRKVFGALLVACSVLAVSVAPAGAITGNYVKDNVHTYVGLIAFYDENGEFVHRCTGELLAPRVVLTAGHCTDDETGTGVNASARIWFQQDAGVHYDPATQHDPVTGYPDSCTGTGGDQLGHLCATGTQMYNYGFNNFAGFPNIHDVGVVILDQPITGLGFATLASDQTLAPLASSKGTQDKTFTVSGYGVSGSAKQGTVNTPSFRERLMAPEKLVTFNNQNTLGYSIQLNGNGDSRGGTCFGDSGGPVFYPSNSNQIVAVTSWGKSNAGCRGDGFYYRTDRQEVINWIRNVAGPYASGIVIS